MATLKYLSQYFSTTLNVGGGIDASQTTGIILQSVSGVHDITEPGQICVTYSDPIDTSVAEWIDYTSINGSNELVGAVRGREGFSAHTHLQNATVAFILSASHHNDVVNAVKKVYNETTDTLLKASAAEVVTGTDDAKIVTPLSAAPYGNSSLSRQAIINGNFDVWQRGTTATNPANNTYLTADRWVNEFSLGGATFPTNIIHSRQILTSGDITNSFYHYRIAPDGAGTSWGVNTFYMTEQRIEHGTRLLCGASKKVTVSFYARSSITNKRLGIGLSQGYGTGGSPTTEEQIAGTVKTLTSSWVKYTHTFTTNTLASKTFGTANDDYLQLSIGVAWGSTFGNARFSSADTETFVGSGTIDIAQVQLCAGDVALPFQPKSYYGEENNAKRFIQYIPFSAVASSTTSLVANIRFAPSLRAVTTVSVNSTIITTGTPDGKITRTGVGATGVLSISSTDSSVGGIAFINFASTPLTAGGYYYGTVVVEGEL